MSLPDPAFLVLTVLLLAAVELAKAARWRELFGTLRPDYPRSLRAIVAGQLTNALLPIRGGEVVRLGLISLEGGSPVVAAAALALAKVVDAICLAVIALAVLGSAVVATAGWRAGVVTLCIVLAAFAASWRRWVLAASRAIPPPREEDPHSSLISPPASRVWLRRLSDRLNGLPFIRRVRLQDASAALSALRSPRGLLVVALATLLVWAAGAAANAAVLAAVGVVPTLDLAARVLVAAYVVGLLPAPPGRLVVYEAGVSAALLSGGVEPATALAASLTLHGCQLAELGLLFGLSLLLTRRIHRSSAPA